MWPFNKNKAPTPRDPAKAYKEKLRASGLLAITAKEEVAQTDGATEVSWGAIVLSQAEYDELLAQRNIAVAKYFQEAQVGKAAIHAAAAMVGSALQPPFQPQTQLYWEDVCADNRVDFAADELTALQNATHHHFDLSLDLLD